MRAKVSVNGKVDRLALDREQHAVHGLAWYATYAELFRQVNGWMGRLKAEGKFGETEALLAQLLTGEYAYQLIGGIPMNQGETHPPGRLRHRAGGFRHPSGARPDAADARRTHPAGSHPRGGSGG